MKTGTNHHQALDPLARFGCDTDVAGEDPDVASPGAVCAAAVPAPSFEAPAASSCSAAVPAPSFEAPASSSCSAAVPAPSSEAPAASSCSAAVPASLIESSVEPPPPAPASFVDAAAGPSLTTASGS